MDTCRQSALVGHSRSRSCLSEAYDCPAFVDFDEGELIDTALAGQKLIDTVLVGQKLIDTVLVGQSAYAGYPVPESSPVVHADTARSGLGSVADYVDPHLVGQGV